MVKKIGQDSVVALYLILSLMAVTYLSNAWGRPKESATAKPSPQIVVGYPTSYEPLPVTVAQSQEDASHSVRREEVLDKFNSDYLETQRRMAAASEKQVSIARFVGEAALLDLVLAAIALCLLMKTYKETRRTAIASIRAANSAARATNIAKEQIRLAREEFASSHRPQIIVRNISVVVENGEMKILYSLTNVGGAKATLVNSWIMTELVLSESPIRNVRALGHDDLGAVPFGAGQYYDFYHTLSTDAKRFIGTDPNHRGFGRLFDAELHFTGGLRYVDELENSRNSVFRRILRRDGAFHKSSDPDHEYSD